MPLATPCRRTPSRFAATVVTGAAAVLLVAGAARAALFLPGTEFTIGSVPTAVVTGDWNEDGNPDLACGNYQGQTLSILLGDGNGGFTAGPTLSDDTGPWAMAVGDLDHDDHLDIAVANKVSDDVVLFLGNGDATFQPKRAFDTVEIRPQGIGLADFDEDGHLDVIIASNIGDHLELFLGDGAGNLSSVGTFAVGQEPEGVAIADLDGDGHLDVAVADRSGDSVSVVLGNGNGGFTSMPDVAVGSTPFGVVIRDFDEDGDPDLAAVNFGHFDVSVALGNGDGTFAAAQTFATGRDPRSIAAVDVDADRHVDLLVGNSRDDDVSILLGDGTGGFAAQQRFGTGQYPHWIAVPDADRSGAPDVATANWDTDDVTVMLNTTVPTPVVLVSLSASRESDAVVLHWQTSFESNHAGFYVERQLPTGDFERLNERLITAPGPYEVRDTAAVPGDVTYRLWAVDRAGAVELVGEVMVRAVPVVTGDRRLGVAPNPGRAPFTIDVSLGDADLDDIAEVTIFDSAGRRVRALYGGRPGPGAHAIAWDGATDAGTVAPAGVYFVRLVAGGTDRVVKAIVVR